MNSINHGSKSNQKNIGTKNNLAGHQHSKSQKTPQMTMSPQSAGPGISDTNEQDEFFVVEIPQYFEQESSNGNTPRMPLRAPGAFPV